MAVLGCKLFEKSEQMFVFLFKLRHKVLTLRFLRNYNAGVFRKTIIYSFGSSKMKELYAKVILYSYPCAESLVEQIDELVEKKALISFRDFSPCEEQCFKILSLTEQKDTILRLKQFVEKALAKFGENDFVLLDYKYFKKLPKEAYAGFDFFERKYFRRQESVLKRFAELMDKYGLTDEVFESEYLSIDFFREMKRREEKRSISYDKKHKFGAKRRENPARKPDSSATVPAAATAAVSVEKKWGESNQKSLSA